MTQKVKNATTTQDPHYKGGNEASGKQNLGKQNPQNRETESSSSHKGGNKGNPARGENRTVQSSNEQGRQGQKK